MTNEYFFLHGFVILFSLLGWESEKRKKSYFFAYTIKTNKKLDDKITSE